MPTTQRSLTWITLALFVIALGFFAYRTVIRRVPWQWDFAIYSAAARAWGEGQNPYDEQLLYNTWRRESGGMLHDISWLQSIVPPTTLALVYPVAALPRRAAFWTWYGLNCAWVALAIAALWDLSRSRRDRVVWLLAPWILFLGPVQLGVHAGQPAIPATGLIVCAMWCAATKREVLAGVLLGFAMGFKLQLAAPFALFYLFFGRWRIVVAAAFAFLVIAAVAVVRMQVAHVIWLEDWLANIRRASSNGGPNDFAGNPNRDHLTNLQVLFYAVFKGKGIAQALTAVVCAVLLIAYGMVLHRCRSSKNEVLALAPLAVLTLLPVYHRYYDASLLVIVLAACLVHWRQASARVGLAIMVLFILPVGWAVNLIRYGHVPAQAAESGTWNVVVMAFWPWVLVVLFVVMLVTLRTACELRQES